MSVGSRSPVIFNESAFREAVKRDLKDEADYGTDDTFTVARARGPRCTAMLRCRKKWRTVVYQIVDEEWDWWYEEGPID